MAHTIRIAGRTTIKVRNSLSPLGVSSSQHRWILELILQEGLQGYLAHKKTPSLRTLLLAYA